MPVPFDPTDADTIFALMSVAVVTAAMLILRLGKDLSPQFKGLVILVLVLGVGMILWRLIPDPDTGPSPPTGTTADWWETWDTPQPGSKSGGDGQ